MDTSQLWNPTYIDWYGAASSPVVMQESNRGVQDRWPLLEPVTSRGVLVSMRVAYGLVLRTNTKQGDTAFKQLPETPCFVSGRPACLSDRLTQHTPPLLAPQQGPTCIWMNCWRSSGPWKPRLQISHMLFLCAVALNWL